MVFFSYVIKVLHYLISKQSGCAVKLPDISFINKVADIFEDQDNHPG